MNRRLIATTALTAAIVAACGGGSDQTTKPTADKTTTAAPTESPEPTETTPAGPTVEKLGETVDESVLTVRLVDYRASVPPAETAEPGNRWDAILVKMCNTGITPEQGPETVFTSYSWQLQDSDDGTYEVSSLGYNQFPSPEFPDEKALAIGKCVKGWIVYPVPKDAKIKRAAFVYDNEDKALWSVK